MELSVFILIISLSICLFIKTAFDNISNATQPGLPPGPPSIPIFSTLELVRKGIHNLEATLRPLFSKYGPIILLRMGNKKAIFINSHDLAYKALITQGSTFSNRPPASVASSYLSCNQHNITSAGYGPLWRLLRRNLTSEMLHPSRIESFAHAREWVLDILFEKLEQESNSGKNSVCVASHFKYAMFCLLVYMCFGDKLDDGIVKQIELIQRELTLSLGTVHFLDAWSKLGKILFRKQWSWLYKIRSKQESIFIPLIRSHKENKSTEGVVAYVDTLLNLSLPDEGGRKLSEEEIVTLCSEFLSGGTNTTYTALQWIMANLVKNQDIQAKLFDEINANSEHDEIKEDDLQKMPYLKAVVLEGLRRHPPSHFVLHHAVSEDTRLEGYVIPKDAVVNFMVAEMGMNSNVWEEPMEFRPERFMCIEDGQAFDVSGSREIKMMPFGAGRRICPASGLAMLHLEYFVANLMKKFEWKPEKGQEVDLSESSEGTVVMKNPLKTHITPRLQTESVTL